MTTQKIEYLVNLIFKKLKDYKAKEIFLEKENLKKFILSLYKKNWIQKKYNRNCYIKNKIINEVMYNFSSLTIILIIIFVVSLYFLFKVTSNAKN